MNHALLLNVLLIAAGTWCVFATCNPTFFLDLLPLEDPLYALEQTKMHLSADGEDDDESNPIGSTAPIKQVSCWNMQLSRGFCF